MSKLEVLVACMNQIDFTLYDKMNLSTDAILANQTCDFSYIETVHSNGSVIKLISSNEKGVGKNRNKALIFSSSEYLLFADDDMIYVDNYESIILDIFKNRPDADVIVFNLNYLNRLTTGRKPCTKFKRIRWWNAMRYGAARIAIRKKALEKANLSFSHLYGGGAPYSSGEDSLFIREALRKGLKMFYCPIVIASVEQRKSTWFKGFTDKYYIDKGILVANAFPKICGILVFYFAFKMRKDSENTSFKKILKLMKRGISVYKKM